MLYNIGEHVWKPVNGSMWVGIVVGAFQKRDGHRYYVVEQTTGNIFVSDPSSLRRVEVLEREA